MHRSGRGTAGAWDRNDHPLVALHLRRQANLLGFGKLELFDMATDDVTALTHASPSNDSSREIVELSPCR